MGNNAEKVGVSRLLDMAGANYGISRRGVERWRVIGNLLYRRRLRRLLHVGVDCAKGAPRAVAGVALRAGAFYARATVHSTQGWPVITIEYAGGPSEPEMVTACRHTVTAGVGVVTRRRSWAWGAWNWLAPW